MTLKLGLELTKPVSRTCAPHHFSIKQMTVSYHPQLVGLEFIRWTSMVMVKNNVTLLWYVWIAYHPDHSGFSGRIVLKRLQEVSRSILSPCLIPCCESLVGQTQES